MPQLTFDEKTIFACLALAALAFFTPSISARRSNRGRREYKKIKFSSVIHASRLFRLVTEAKNKASPDMSDAYFVDFDYYLLLVCGNFFDSLGDFNVIFGHSLLSCSCLFEESSY